MASTLGARGTLSCRRREREAEVLLDGDAALSVGRSPHRPRQELRVRRCGGTHDAHAGIQRASSDGVGRLRIAGRECGDRSRRRSGGLDRRKHPQYAPPDQADGHELRLVARSRDLQAGVLSLESVDIHAPLPRGPRVQARSAGELVPARPNRARQRTGRRRPMLAMRASRRAAKSLAMVPAHHGLCRPPVARPRPADRLARAYSHDATQLDRTQRRRDRSIRGRRTRRDHRSLHDAARHDLRRDVSGGGAGASRRRIAQKPRLAGARERHRCVCRKPWFEVRTRADELDGKARHLYRRPCDSSALTAARADLAHQLRARRVRKRRGDGRARARRTRFRVRATIRAAGRAGDRACRPRWFRGRRTSVRRRRPAHRERRFQRDVERESARLDCRAARGDGLGREERQLQAARLAHLAATLLGNADPDRPLSRLRRSPGSRRPAPDSPTAARALDRRRVASWFDPVVRRNDVPAVRRSSQTRDRYHGHVLRILVVLSALPRPAQRSPAMGSTARGALDERRSVYRRRRAHRSASALRAVLLKFFHDNGWVSGSDEPFERLFHQGLLLRDGDKMSKSRGNVVGIDATAERYGVDAMRLFLLYVTPPEETSNWTDDGISGQFVCSTASGAPANLFLAQAQGRRTKRRSRKTRANEPFCGRSTSPRSPPWTKRCRGAFTTTRRSPNSTSSSTP